MITRSCGSSLCSRRDKGVHTDRRKDTQRYIPSSIALIKNIYLLQACFIGKLGAQLSCTVCLTRTACQMRQRSPWCCMYARVRVCLRMYVGASARAAADVAAADVATVRAASCACARLLLAIRSLGGAVGERQETKRKGRSGRVGSDR